MPETFPINSRTFNLAGENIDTDQIIPARFLTTTSRTGLGRFAFPGGKTLDLTEKTRK